MHPFNIDMTKIKKKKRIKKKINCFIEAKGRKEREEGKGERKKSRPSFSGGEEIKKKKRQMCASFVLSVEPLFSCPLLAYFFSFCSSLFLFSGSSVKDENELCNLEFFLPKV